MAEIRAQLDQAERDFTRQQELLRRQLVSEQSMDAAQAQRDTLRAKLASAEEQVRVAQESVSVASVQLDNTVIRAPFAGIVVVALVRSGRGEISPEAEIALDGVPTADALGRPMRDIVRDAVEGTIVSIPRDRRKDGEMVREAVRRSVRSAVENAWGKRPIAKVLLVQAPR